MPISIKSVFDNITTLHGVSYFTREKGSRLFIWSAIMLGNLLLTIAYILVIRTRFNSDQIITRINANCKVSQTPFPAVSICNFNIVSLKGTNRITQILKSNKISKTDIENFYRNLPSLTHFLNVNENIGNDSRIMEILKRHYFNTDSIMEEVHQKCENLLLYCAFNRKMKDCSEMFNLIKTLDGYCCAFNYAALKDGSIDELSNDENIEYYEDQNGGFEKTKDILVTSESGRGSGLSVVLNVEPDDYPQWSLTPYYGAKVLICDPNDYPEMTVLYKYVAIGESLDIKVEPQIFQSEDDIKRVPINKRGCAFNDEVFLEHTDRYSTETCMTECRMKGYVKQCGCIPYKYPRDKSSRVCDFEDLKCLHNLRVHNVTRNEDCNPVCYIECWDKKYRITSDVMSFLVDFYPRNVTEGRNISELSSIQVYFAKSTCNCYRKMLLIDFNYFIATYGGVFSLSFGASLITVFEFVYLFVSFLVRFICKYFINKQFITYVEFSIS